MIFHVLSSFDQADLAYDMITRPDFPSYGNWIVRNATSLWEDFQPEGGTVNSLNHHFFGDISSWFMQAITGLVYNPDDNNLKRLDVKPHFISKLTHAKAEHKTPLGKVSIFWERKAETILLHIDIPKDFQGNIYAPKGYVFDNQKAVLPLCSGTYRLNTTLSYVTKSA